MDTVLLSKENGIATITLNRPKAFNSLNAELGKAFIAALTDCSNDENIRTVILTANGKAFCAGQDIKEVTDPASHPGFNSLLSDRYAPIVRLIYNMKKPVIAAVNGVAAGAGASFAVACDVILATESASFIQAFSGIGLIPDSAGTYTLPRRIGSAKASALMMLGDKVSAEEAERIGMIYKYFPDDTFEEEVQKIANKLASLPTKGLYLTKQALNATWENDFEEQLALEEKYQSEASQTEDYAEGVSAFVEKRKPVFKGK